MQKKLIIVVIMLGILALSACGFVKDKQEAQKVVESLLNERIAEGGFASAHYYSGIFWKNTDAENWKRIQRMVGKTMGDLQSYELNDWKMRASIEGGQYPGIFVVLLYDTQYEKGSGMERLTLYKPKNGETYRIISHNFDSPEIQRMLQQTTESADSRK